MQQQLMQSSILCWTIVLHHTGSCSVHGQHTQVVGTHTVQKNTHSTTIPPGADQQLNIPPPSPFFVAQDYEAVIAHNSQVLNTHADAQPGAQSGAQPTSSCTMLEDQRVEGPMLLPNGCDNRVRSASECCQRCQVQHGCVAWTFSRLTNAQCPGGCWLVGVGANVQSMAEVGYVTGVVVNTMVAGGDQRHDDGSVRMTAALEEVCMLGCSDMM